ncbi:MAG: hypothetical protein KDA92_02510 [Planctomycetales bacterium]|nr:hypothetical protein [Planctomycetales bacterium]
MRACLAAILMLCCVSVGHADENELHRYLYVATPGIRDYLEFGGHGVIVFDIDDGHRFVRRIPFDGRRQDGRPLNVKGVCANAMTQRLYVSTLEHLICIDLVTDKVLWQNSYEGGCDRMSIAPNGSEIYLPTLEKDHWKVVDAKDGRELARITPDSGSHNTIYGLSGKFAYLAGLRSPNLAVVDTVSREIVKQVGPFANSIRPFTVNRSETRCYVNINELLGFEIGDIVSGQKLARVEVAGVPHGPVKRHGCPSHGIGLTPDEREVWVTDGHNQMLHVFDNTTMPPQQRTSIKLREQPGWVTFSLDGKFAYASTGEVIDTATKQILVGLSDEQGREVHSEKVVEVQFQNDRVVATGDQFGLGRRLP